MNPLQVADAVKSGLSMVCATCAHYWRGRKDGAPSCGKIDCCGPFWEGAFPSYEGPIKDFERQCFVCGNPEVMGVFKLPAESRRFGICEVHVKLSEKPDIADLLLITR